LRLAGLSTEGDIVSARFVYFILAHHRPEQLRLLVDSISDRDELVLLHVDLKSMMGLRAERNGTWRMARRLAHDYPKIILMRPRFTNWGGWSLSQILLDAIDIALERDGGWTHFINLSGQCLPIKPLDNIRAQVGAAGQQIFVELRHFSTLPADDWHLRWHPMIELPHKCVRRAGPKPRPGGFELEFKGSQWCILPRAFCEWQRNADITRQITRYLRGLLLSDELLIQTLVRNGPWRDQVAQFYGREIVWPGPQVMTMDHWDRLDRSPALFARKFDVNLDRDVVAAVLEKVACRAAMPRVS
jgi:Core-2/I-Branching enzyme